MPEVSKTTCNGIDPLETDLAASPNAWESTIRVAGTGIGGVCLRFTLIVFLGVQLSCSVNWHPEDKGWAKIPAGTYRIGNSESSSPVCEVETAGFSMQRTEVTVGQFVRFLNHTKPDPLFSSPQIEYERGRYRALVPLRLPVAFVSLGDAMAYGDWISQRHRGQYRLPSAEEWEIAASGGNAGVRYPWGWAPAVGRAHFDADGPELVGRFAPNPFGLFDMAGNVAEWCRPGKQDADHAPALGGSWAERDPNLLRIHHRLKFPVTYRDADVGFRLVRPIY